MILARLIFLAAVLFGLFRLETRVLGAAAQNLAMVCSTNVSK